MYNYSWAVVVDHKSFCGRLQKIKGGGSVFLEMKEKTLTFLTSELLGSVVQVMMRETARRVSLEFTKSVGSICLARDSIYFRMATFTYTTETAALSN